MNTSGRMVSERLAWTQAVVSDVADEAPEWLDDGHALLDDLRAVMHGEMDPRAMNEARVRHWQGYGRNFEGVAVAVGAPSVKEWLLSETGQSAVASVARGAD